MRDKLVHTEPNAIAHASEFVPDDPGLTRIRGGGRAAQWNLSAESGVAAPQGWSHQRAAGRPAAAARTWRCSTVHIARSDRRFPSRVDSGVSNRAQLAPAQDDKQQCRSRLLLATKTAVRG